jgi:DMSO/TMAO reductase YedYZ heme-binding membrane subunit
MRIVLLLLAGECEHVIFFCPFACHVWEGVKASFDIQLFRKIFRSLNQWLFEFLARSSGISGRPEMQCEMVKNLVMQRIAARTKHILT